MKLHSSVSYRPRDREGQKIKSPIAARLATGLKDNNEFQRESSTTTRASGAMSALADIGLLDLWRRLGGRDPRRGRASAFWRETNDLNVSLDAERCIWFDFVSGVGGGVLALVQTGLQCDRREAVQWLVTEGFLADEQWSPIERRKHACTRIAAATVSSDILAWRSALIDEANRAKFAAVEAMDDEELARAARLCNLLENGSPENIALEFTRQKRADPGATARLIGTGRKHEIECRRFTAAVVSLLALATAAEVNDAA